MQCKYSNYFVDYKKKRLFNKVYLGDSPPRQNVLWQG